MRYTFAILLTIGSLYQGQAQLVVWTGLGDNQSWADTANWNQPKGPQSGDSVLIENVDTVLLEVTAPHVGDHFTCFGEFIVH